jgi:hypothetical protein
MCNVHHHSRYMKRPRASNATRKSLSATKALSARLTSGPHTWGRPLHNGRGSHRTWPPPPACHHIPPLPPWRSGPSTRPRAPPHSPARGGCNPAPTRGASGGACPYLVCGGRGVRDEGGETPDGRYMQPVESHVGSNDNSVNIRHAREVPRCCVQKPCITSAPLIRREGVGVAAGRAEVIRAGEDRQDLPRLVDPLVQLRQRLHKVPDLVLRPCITKGT